MGLTTLLPGGARMTPNTALCFLLCGWALWQRGRGIAAAICAAGAICLAAASLSEDILGLDYGIDLILFPDRVVQAADQNSTPGRMSPATAWGFILSGLALLVPTKLERGVWFQQLMAMPVGLISLTGILGLAHGFALQASLGSFDTMAVHTAGCFVLLFLGIIILSPERGWMATVTSPYAGGLAFRRIAPFGLVLVVIGYWIQVLGGRVGLYDLELGVELFAATLLGGCGWLLWSSANLLNQSDEIQQRDYQRLQEALEVQGRYQAIVESSSEAIISASADGILTSWNPAAERIFGYTAEEAIGTPVQDLLPVLSSELQLFSQSKPVHSQLPQVRELTNRRKDGKQVEVQAMSSAVLDADGQVSGISVIARDLTEAKAVQQQAQEIALEIQQLRLMLENHAILAVTDVAGRITYVNDGFCRISQYTRGELLGENHRIVNSGYHPKEFFAEMWQTICSGNVWKGEIRNRAKDGSIYWVDTTIVPLLNDKGKPRQYVALRSDITRQKSSLVAALQDRNAALERSNAALEEFAYIASHDLQEPLRGVSGCIQLLQSNYQGSLDEKADEFIVHAVDNLARMRQLIQDLLDYSRLDRGEIPLELLDMTLVVSNAMENLETAIAESHAQVQVGQLPSIEADRSQMTLLMQNLLGNAIKFRGADPPVIQVQAQPYGEDQWEITVSDNGIGIESAYHERIFGVFQRLHTRRLYSGTGIGLAICRRIVSRHGGKIWVESVPDKGATFHIVLPTRKKEEDHESSPSPGEHPVGRR